MGKVGILALLLAGAAASQDSTRVDSTGVETASAPAAQDAGAETCRDLMSRVKSSDCMRPVARFLDGAAVVLGFALHSSQMTLKRNDSVVARLSGFLTPAPYYAFFLPRRFFGSSRYGWEVSADYGSSVAVYQSISRGGRDHVTDLGTYSLVTMAAISPSVFFAIGARDEEPDVHSRLGLGLGLGLASVRGTAYYTEAPEDGGNSACRDAATRFADGGENKGGLKAACVLRAFRRFDLGGSTRLFWDWRWRFLYGGVDANGLRLRGSGLELEPMGIALKLAYIHDL